MYGCWIRELLTELLQNCNGFFTAHRHPPFLKLRQFRQRRETFINTDTRLFKIQTSDMGPPPHPPGRASSISCRFHCPAKCPIPVHWLLERKSYILMRAKVIQFFSQAQRQFFTNPTSPPAPPQLNDFPFAQLFSFLSTTTTISPFFPLLHLHI